MKHDVLIIGGGPAGVSAGMWADELGMSSAIVDRGTTVGGQLANVHNPIRNFPGAEYANGADLSRFLRDQLAKRSTELMLGNEVIKVNLAAKELGLSNGETISGESLILATGVRRRKLNIPGEDEFCGKGVLDSGARDPQRVTGKTVAIIGGGDSAFENALILSEYAQRILLVHRRDEFSARREFVSKVQGTSNIEIIVDSTVTEFTGSNELRSMTVVDGRKKTSESFEIDSSLIRIGYDPNSELFREHLETDEHGYLIVDRIGQTNVTNVYAIGDICRPHSQSISSAVGDGSAAVMSIFANL